ncbi:hypothetical protein [Sphingobium yanoikuyae]|uniref:hypothetical protein n=1 Tax=Sphingobium yanoikuyae TaxID=13690 RepID=UPI0035B0C7A6
MFSTSTLAHRCRRGGGGRPAPQVSGNYAGIKTFASTGESLAYRFFVAECEEAAPIASGRARNADYSTKNAGNSVLAALWGALDETADYSGLAGDDFLIETGLVEGQWGFDLPTDLIIGLSDLPEAEFSQIADRWASSNELFDYGTEMIPLLVTVGLLPVWLTPR